MKDIRLIRDRITGEIKDFAFVEYFSIDEAMFALDRIRQDPIRIKNNPLFVTFSKLKRNEDYKVH